MSSSLVSMKKQFKYFTIIFLGIMALWYLFVFKDETLLGKLESIDTSFNSLNDKGCNFVANPFDPRISGYYQKLSPLQCDSIQNKETAFINGTLMLLNPNSSCEYRYFGHNTGVDDKTVKYEEWLPLNSTPVKLEKDFVDVSCINELGNETYRYQWATVIPKNVSIETKKPFEDETEDQLSFIMIGIDSMSLSNMFRQTPKTMKMLDKLGFDVMEKHVKVGENSYPNIMSIFLGGHVMDMYQKVKEFNATISSEPDTRFDNWTTLPWFTFGKRGYATFFSEDFPKNGLFHYGGNMGFIVRQLSDHYIRPWSLAIETTSNLKKKSSSFCYDDVPLHKLPLNYLESFLKGYEGKSKFVYQWFTDISHDDMNTPQYFDAGFPEFLSTVEPYFNKSIVIVFSDHGPRVTDFRQTFLGRLESKLPFLSVRLPEWFKKKHPMISANLKANRKVLTNHFDLHALLKHTLQGNFSTLDAPLLPRGRSLLSSIPHRTCYDAEIPSQYCPCFEETQLPPSNGIKYANLLLQKIHDYFIEKNVTEKCLWMKFKIVTSLSRTIPPSTDGISNDIHYHVQFSVQSPSNAIFEGVVIEDDSIGNMTALNDIERVNKYGNTSLCVENSPILRKFCYCI